ncbi:MAG: hypothetical protein D6805_07095, partial [Planctomycetota bacterium]
MAKIHCGFWGIGVFFCLFLSPLYGEIIYLNDGTFVRGKVVDQDEEQVWILRKGIRLSIPRHRISRIEGRGESSLQIYKKKLAKIKPGDAQAHYELGKWLKSVNMKKEAREEFIKAIILDPDHRAAREELGYIKTPEGWRLIGETSSPRRRVLRRPPAFRGHLSREVRKVLQELVTAKPSEVQRLERRLAQIRKKIHRQFLSHLQSGNRQQRASALSKVKKLDPEFVSEVQRKEVVDERGLKKLSALFEIYLQKYFDKQVALYLYSQRARLIYRVKSIVRKLEKLVSAVGGTGQLKIRQKYLEKWQKCRKEALRVIFDKKIYPDANHGASGQPIVDKKVNALREVWQFFDILVQRDLSRILRTPVKVLKKMLEKFQLRLRQIRRLERVLGHYPLSSWGKDWKIFRGELSPRARVLLRYRVGDISGALRE